MLRRRRIALAVFALVLLAVAGRQPTANLRVIAHDAGDVAPHRFQAAVDLGVMAVSILVTWTSKRLAA